MPSRTVTAARSPKDFNRIRAAFMRRVSAPNIPHAAFKLAYVIAFKYMNGETQTARPAQETLAADLNVSVRTVQRLLDILEPLGLVIVLGHGPNRASTYWIDPEKATPVSPIKTTPVSPIEGRIGDNRRPNRRQPVHEKATPVSPQLKKKNQEEEPRRKKDSLALRARERDSPPASRDSKKSPAKRAPAARPAPKPELDDCFERFWAVYPKRVAKEAARKAHAAAIKRGADPETLIATAQRYAGERAGQNPRFTKHPTTWLNGGCWEDEAPPGDVIDEDGTLVAYEHQQSGFDRIVEELNAAHVIDPKTGF